MVTDDEPCLLIVDDEEELLSSLDTFFTLRGWNVSTCSDPTKAEVALTDSGARVVLMDIMMPEVDGLELLDRLKRRDQPVEVVMMTGCKDRGKSLDWWHEAWQNGAFDYLLKPFPSLGNVEAVLQRALQQIERWRHSGLTVMGSDDDEK